MRGQIGVGKLFAIILGVIVLVIVIVGATTGVFQPMFERIGAKGDELLIKLNTEKNIEANEDYSCYSTVKTINDQEVNWTICEDGEYFNATQGLDGLTINGVKITKVFYGKNDIIKYYLKDDVREYKISKSNSYEEWLKLMKNEDLLNISYLRSNLTEKGTNKTNFGDYKDLDDYYFFSNKTFPMFLFVEHRMNNDYQLKNCLDIKTPFGYQFKLDFFSNNLILYPNMLYFNNNFINSNCKVYLPDSYVNEGNEIIIKNNIFDNQILQTYLGHLEGGSVSLAECRNSQERITRNYPEFIQYFSQYYSDCTTICKKVTFINSNTCDDICQEYYNYYDIFYNIFNGDCNSENADIQNNKYENFIKNITYQKIWLGVLQNSIILGYRIKDNSDSNFRDPEKGKIIFDAILIEFKQKTSEEQQRIFSEMQKQFNDLRTDDFNVEYKINQTINISDYYSECGKWHIETGVNVVTYGRDYGIIYNSLDKFERKMKNKNTQCKKENFSSLKKFVIVEYNSIAKIWNLNLSSQILNSEDLNNLEKEIKRSIELSNLYSYKSLRVN